MASESDTVEVVSITARDLQWLTYAVRNVQTRTAGESAIRQDLTVRFGVMLDDNHEMKDFVITLTPCEAMLLTWAVKEGRCRTGEDMLTRGRLEQLFNEASDL